MLIVFARILILLKVGDSIKRTEMQFSFGAKVLQIWVCGCFYLSLIIFVIKIFVVNDNSNSILLMSKTQSSLMSSNNNNNNNNNNNFNSSPYGKYNEERSTKNKHILMPHKDKGYSKSRKLNITFQQEILNQADENIIILSTTDYYYLDLALNLHHTFEMFNTTNYVFACSHHKACEELARRNIQ